MSGQIEALPDARTRMRETICGPCGLMSRVYCVNCGADGGLITEEWAESVFYLCDKCSHYGIAAEALSQAADALQVPEGLLKGQQAPPDKTELFQRWKDILNASKRGKRMGIKLFLVEGLPKAPEVSPDPHVFPMFHIPGKAEEYKWSELPVGACWVRPDGTHLVKIPADNEGKYTSAFCPEIEKGNANGWKVEGVAPNITVSPSIFCNPNGNPPGWHGWIRDGELVSC